MIAFSCAPSESVFSAAGRIDAGAWAAVGGIEIREANGAVEGESRLARGLHIDPEFSSASRRSEAFSSGEARSASALRRL
jgi:hypothetical protein